MWIIFMLLPILALAYLAWHLWCLLPLAAVWKAVIIALGVGSFLLMFLSVARKFDSLPLGLASACYDIGTSSIFVMLYMFMMFLLLDIGRLVRLVPKAWLYDNWVTTGVLGVLLVGIFVYGNIHYNNKVREELTLTTDKPLQKELKMVLISDMHIGYHNRRSELARWVDLLNAEHADMILVAGDIIDGSMRPLMEERMAEEFRRLNAPVYACLGNHEYYAGDRDAEQFYRDAGIHLLRDSVAMVNGIAIIGRDDRTNVGRKSVKELAVGGAYTILLDHQPYHLERTEAAGVDFQFSGHTHHGQVWPISWITDTIYECAFGAYQRGNTRYYVSSGLGIWGGKFRIGTRSEYVVVTLRNEK
ncbi:MAG: metallophosphoesterase [Prevotella sp.]|nr:metallophosphoesterase [Prevotella sp.]